MKKKSREFVNINLILRSAWNEVLLYYYNVRWYDPSIMRFIQPDSIVPSIGEGGNPIAIGYVPQGNYSALVVDYHENQFLYQLNQENRARLQYPNIRLPNVPTNPQAFDRYAYSFNNPVKYNDPSGHCPFCIVITVALIAAIVIPWISSDTADVNQVYEANSWDQFWNEAKPRIDLSADFLFAGLIGGGAVQTFSPSTYVDPNKLHHVFDNPYHNLDGLIKVYNGSQQDAYDTVAKMFTNVAGNYSTQQLKAGIEIVVNGLTITVRGNIVDGVVKIGDFWIKNP